MNILFNTSHQRQCGCKDSFRSQVHKKMQENYIVGIYARLSRDDERAGESVSIENQKMILQRYADEHHFLNTKFFVDDGFSGVSFEREGLQAMLQEVEAGRVATVITKDYCAIIGLNQKDLENQGILA